MIYQSPYGSILIQADEQGLTALHYLLKESEEVQPNSKQAQIYLEQTVQQLEEYFAKKRKSFALPLHLTTGTIFQRKVWEALCAIPYGETRTYQEIAISVGSPKAVRAIGQANRNNPIAIVIPCHRVIGKNGKMTGYMGAGAEGIQIKEHLLTLEKNSLQ